MRDRTKLKDTILVLDSLSLKSLHNGTLEPINYKPTQFIGKHKNEYTQRGVLEGLFSAFLSSSTTHDPNIETVFWEAETKNHFLMQQL